MLEYVEQHRGKGLNYLFFDEIHEVEGWQFACKTLRLDGTSVFITTDELDYSTSVVRHIKLKDFLMMESL